MRARGGPTSLFFLATVFTVTFEKVHWQVAGTVELAGRARDPVPARLLARPGRPLRRARAALGARRRVLPRRVPARLPDRLLQPGHAPGARAVREGAGQVPDPLPVPARGRSRTWRGAASATSGGRSAGSWRGWSSTRPTACCSCSRRARGRTSTRTFLQPLTGGASAINVYGAVERVERLPPERAHGRPEPPRDHARHPAPRPARRSTCGSSAGTAGRTGSRRSLGFLLPRRAGDALAQRPARARARAARARGAVPALRLLARAARAARGRRGHRRVRRSQPAPLLRGRAPLADPDRRQVDLRALRRLRLRPAGAAPAPAVRARAEQLLGLLRVRHRQDELGAALVLRRAGRRDRARRDGAVRGLPLVDLPAAPRGARDRAARSRPRATRSRRGCGRSRGG